MVNSFKLTQMAELAGQEKKHAKDIKTAQYYKSDYIAVQMIKTFFLTTIGDILVLILYLAGHMDWVEENVDKMNYAAVGGGLLIGYILTVAFYMVITYIIASHRYVRARKFVRRYETELHRLERMEKLMALEKNNRKGTKE